MGQHSVDCPRCQGGGEISLIQESPITGKRSKVVAACPVCSGTGKASLLERMAVKQGPVYRQRDVA